jgi:hypothetical protein
VETEGTGGHLGTPTVSEWQSSAKTKKRHNRIPKEAVFRFALSMAPELSASNSSREGKLKSSSQHCMEKVSAQIRKVPSV